MGNIYYDEKIGSYIDLSKILDISEIKYYPHSDGVGCFIGKTPKSFTHQNQSYFKIRYQLKEKPVTYYVKGENEGKEAFNNLINAWREFNK